MEADGAIRAAYKPSQSTPGKGVLLVFVAKLGSETVKGPDANGVWQNVYPATAFLIPAIQVNVVT